MKKLVIHIGYHKTGSTMLQKHVFPLLQGVSYLGKSYAHTSLENQIFSVLSETSGSPFKSPDIWELLVSHPCYKENQPILLSWEGLVGSPWPDSYRSSRLIADRLYSLFGNDLKIIITIREHISLLKALYKHSIAEGSTLSFSSFLMNKDFFDPRAIAFSPLLRHYIDLFSARNILLISNEQLFTYPSLVLRLIQDFSSATSLGNAHIPDYKIRTGPTGSFLALLRIINKFRSSDLHPEHKFPRSDKALSLASTFFSYLDRVYRLPVRATSFELLNREPELLAYYAEDYRILRLIHSDLKYSIQNNLFDSCND